MRNFKIAFRSLLKKGQGNVVKILSLAVGLAVGLLLIAKIYFEFNYDNFYPGIENIYQIKTNYSIGDDDFKTISQISGGIALGMKNEIPEVEAATRITIFGDDAFYTIDKKRYKAEFWMADNMYFDVLPRPILFGDAKDVLSRPMHAMISRSLAEKMGGISKAVGQTIEFESFPGRMVTIGGVFEDIPDNTHLKFDALLSMSSILSFFQYDGTENWVGNDRYIGYVKLFPGTDPEDLSSSIFQMQQRHQNLEELKEAGYSIEYFLYPLADIHSNLPDFQKLMVVLFILAFAVIFTAVMNYILVVISSLVNRSKEIAIHKCYGASGKNITQAVLSETLLHLLISLVISACIILVFRHTVQNIFGHSIKGLFTFNSILFIGIVCVFVFIFTGFVPAKIFSRTQVSTSFRNFKESRKVWKLILLFLQFTASSFLISLLLIIGLQYNLMINNDPGYKYENVLYYYASGVEKNNIQSVLDELKKSPEVESVAIGSSLLFEASGNNVYVPGDDKVQFNIGDFYCVDENFLSLFEISIIEGTGFDGNTSEPTHIVVSESFSNKLSELQNWKNGVVGKNVFISEHEELLTIVGVYRDILFGTVEYNNYRPTAIFYKNDNFASDLIFIKLRQINPDNIEKVTDVLQTSLPDRKDVVATPYKTTMLGLYSSFKDLRDIILIVGVVIFIISIIGLIGYTRNEINRRSAEIAIRKINGARVNDINKLFILNILYIAIPSIILGSVITMIVANKWMENFVKTVDISVWHFLISGLAILTVIISVTLICIYKISIRNPVDSIKSE